MQHQRSLLFKGNDPSLFKGHSFASYSLFLQGPPSSRAMTSACSGTAPRPAGPVAAVLLQLGPVQPQRESVEPDTALPETLHFERIMSSVRHRSIGKESRPLSTQTGAKRVPQHLSRTPPGMKIRIGYMGAGAFRVHTLCCAILPRRRRRREHPEDHKSLLAL